MIDEHFKKIFSQQVKVNLIAVITYGHNKNPVKVEGLYFLIKGKPLKLHDINSWSEYKKYGVDIKPETEKLK